MASIPAYLRERAAPYLSEPALRYFDGRGRREITYRELFERIDAFAKGLVALGIEPGERVFLLADSSPKWIVADLGIQRAGAICVPRGADTTAREAEYILRHSGSTVIVADNPRLLDRIPDSGLPIKAYVTLTGERTNTTGYDRLLEIGKGEPLPLVGKDIATIVYTSGTTGPPKGVMLTHDNILHNVRVTPDVIHVGPGDVALSVLPSWHMFERTVEYIVLSVGATLSYSSLRTLKKDLLSERPTLLAAVPRLYEGVQTSFHAKLAERKGFGKWLGTFLLHRATGWTRKRRRAQGLLLDPRGKPGSRIAAAIGSLFAAPLGRLGRAMVGRKVRAAVGGRLRIAISGGGMLPLHLDVFLDALGVPIYVGYGLTETSPVVTLRRPEANVLGTIGRALPECEIRVTGPSGEVLGPMETGELEVKGPQVMPGYYRDEEATKAVFREDGWFRTGDLVAITKKGDVLFTGRLKETIVLAGGENIEPNPIESRILESPLIRQVMVVGQDRKNLGALVVPETEAAEAEAKARGIGVFELVKDEIQRLVTASEGFKPREKVTKLKIMDHEFTVENGTLTRTLKLKRNVILDHYARDIESMYGG